ncbi:protein BCCIP homolog [Paramacrobiotus metropolitanus]|uniref:protein BCCIP homolog n=1 Tax=Paramacrobiotus metropolitanus TaxID=2943436 RepID=UPI00244606B2|nr:protein BCCIP homolog [Paramacrobiotus metropolitanus]
MAQPEEDNETESGASESEETGSSEEEEEAETSNEIINVDFEARSPEESDCEGIRKLLFQLLPQTTINLRELSELVISQNYIGAVIFQPTDEGPSEESAQSTDDEEDIFGLTTVVNLTARKDKQCIKDFTRFLKEKYDLQKDCNESRARFSDLFEEKLGNVGWIINERFINLPSQIAPSMFQSLKKDVEDAASKSMPYKMDKTLLIAKAHIPKGGSSKNPVFSNDEEELLFEKSLASFCYTTGNEKDTTSATAEWKNKKDKELVSIRIVMLLEPSTVFKQVDAFSSLLSGM